MYSVLKFKFQLIFLLDRKIYVLSMLNENLKMDK